MRILVPVVSLLSLAVVGCSGLPAGDSMSRTASEPGQFNDVSSVAGIKTEGARGVGWADYDKDGCVDLLVSQKASAKLFRSTCHGQFIDVSESAGIRQPVGGFGVAWADYDGDLDLDVYIASADAPNVLYRNNGDGTFSDVAAAAGVADPRASMGAAWADMDGDGDLDLFVANRFYPKPDSDITDRLYRNDGNGRFTDIGLESKLAVPDRKTFMGTWFDFDDNGTLDIYLAVDFADDVLYSNDGSGRFTDVSATSGIRGPAHAMGLAVGDINNDGCFDLLSTNNTRGEASDEEHGPSTLYVNDCKGGFRDMTTSWGIEDRGTVDWGVHLIDWNNDGFQDLAIVSGGMLEKGEQETSVLYENRDGRFVNVTQRAMAVVTGAAFGSAWADYDNDGDLDWFIANAKRNSALLENRAAQGNYFRVKLKGRAPNPDAIGARVQLTSAGASQTRQIQAGSGFASMDETVAHFGLGARDQVDGIKVTWPNGEVTDLAILLRPNQTIVIGQEK